MNSKNKSLSIITITYNSQDIIVDTMKSVLHQSYRPLQYILIDGASTDETFFRIKELLPQFEVAGIDVITLSEPDEGISDAFNKGISMADGDIIGIINSGDEYVEDIFKVIMKSFGDNTDIFCGDVLWHDQENGIDYIRRSNINWSVLKYEMTIMHPSCFVKKNVYLDCGVFDKKYIYAMDYDLLCRFYRMKKSFFYKPVVVAKMTSNGVSDTDIEKVLKEVFLINRENGIWKVNAWIYKFIIITRNKIAAILKRLHLIWKLYKGINGNEDKVQSK